MKYRFIKLLSLSLTTVLGLVLTDFETYLASRQEALTKNWEKLDGSGAKFSYDEWHREGGSWGVTRVLQGGSIIEKGAVSTTYSRGILSEERAQAMSARGRIAETGAEYQASALSIVLHAASPMIPTFRADIRVFRVKNKVWYGGGADLTPYYLFDDDVKEWHAFWHSLCGDYSVKLYPRFKRWCDEYFYLHLREERRGVGGIFFDDLSPDTENDYDPHLFCRAVADAFEQSWNPIVERRRNILYTEKQKRWQLLRRGRYLEFNLLHDRGVKFGLTPESIERVMVSAPPLIAWEYGLSEPEPGTDESKLLNVLRGEARGWLSS
uniref:Coproporphyrinogen oxidase n=1 Tax=Aureoumbra lagunensis TaxID=44058 RepID=A0A7S3K7G1_9STRA|mmetsp:Transcript_3260/g.4520  ORF Transcript_3260/g.4520 Transcript_3260/m.4520 type:complete len:323 (-) Transcript_3260:48-1016(-)